MVESTSHALVNTSHFIIGEIGMGNTPPIVDRDRGNGTSNCPDSASGQFPPRLKVQTVSGL